MSLKIKEQGWQAGLAPTHKKEIFSRRTMISMGNYSVLVSSGGWTKDWNPEESGDGLIDVKSLTAMQFKLQSKVYLMIEGRDGIEIVQYSTLFDFSSPDEMDESHDNRVYDVRKAMQDGADFGELALSPSIEVNK